MSCAPLRPLVAEYICFYVVVYSSTIFLNIHWFLDKTGRSGTTFQLVNGFFLIATFFGVRLMMGAKTVGVVQLFRLFYLPLAIEFFVVVAVVKSIG